jgi:hypothetical protein
VSDAPVAVVETPLFVRQADAIWNGEERHAFIDFVARNPSAGDLIPGTSGIRKVRWARAGSGKRGGVRVIYFFHDRAMPIYLLLVYAKAARTDLSADEKRRVASLARALKEAHRR